MADSSSNSGALLDTQNVTSLIFNSIVGAVCITGSDDLTYLVHLVSDHMGLWSIDHVEEI